MSKSHQVAFNPGATTGYGSDLSAAEPTDMDFKNNCAVVTALKEANVLLFETSLVQVNHYEYFE